MQVRFAFLCLLILLISCKKEDESLRYYKFQKDDKNWFTDYKTGDTITFISATAPARKYRVLNVYDYRKIEWNPSFVDDPQFYYDTREIELSRLEHPFPRNSSGHYSIQILRWPLKNAANEFILSSNESNLVVSGFFDDYNEYGFAPKLVYFYSGQPANYTSLAINGKVYNDVVYIKSSNPDGKCGNCPNANPDDDWILRVNHVYYHPQSGIIKFSNIDGDTWEIKR